MVVIPVIALLYSLSSRDRIDLIEPFVVHAMPGSSGVQVDPETKISNDVLNDDVMNNCFFVFKYIWNYFNINKLNFIHFVSSVRTKVQITINMKLIGQHSQTEKLFSK